MSAGIKTLIQNNIASGLTLLAKVFCQIEHPENNQISQYIG